MITILCLGKIKENYLNEMLNDYKKRISKYEKLKIIELKDDEDINKEKENLLKYLNKKDYIITLEIEGKVLDSLTFAQKIEQIKTINSHLVFVIGSSNGLHDDIKKLANEHLSFSKMTFPHGLFRAILLEQIYRACKINNHESYHK